MSTVVNTTYHLKVGTPAQWASSNEVLDRGEPGLEVFPDGTFKMKIGNGVKPWDQLQYYADLSAHVNSLNPHPVYDDGPSLSSYYQNRKSVV